MCSQPYESFFSARAKRCEKKLRRFSADIKIRFYKKESCINLRCSRILSRGLKMISAKDIYLRKRDRFYVFKNFNFYHLNLIFKMIEFNPFTLWTPHETIESLLKIFLNFDIQLAAYPSKEIDAIRS